jgi:carbonic anhydrase
MQLYHVHAGRQRIAAISVLIQTKPGGHNDYFQDAINAFQYQADSDRAQCANKIQNNRQMIERVHRSLMGENATTKLMEEDFESWARYSTLLADPEFLKRGREYNRILSEIWNPYDPALIPTFWFYGYEGSLTEPPCTEVVSWFVMDTPMTISPQQLDQMKTILFTHVDPECNATSTQFAGSVARPIQESHGRQVWKCTRKNFIPDAERMKSS